MRTKLILSYLFILSLFVSNANTDKYRLILVDDPATTITVAWNQISGINPTLYYDTIDHGTNIGLYTFSKTEDRATLSRGMDNRFVRLTGLTPNTNYYFVISDSLGTSQRFWFRTAPDDNSRLSFIAGGDSRNNTTPRQKANLLVSKLKPHAVFFGGDMTDTDSNIEWQEWFDDWQLTTASDGRMFPIVPTRGNHEGSSVIYELFDTPNTNSYYAITFGNNLIRAYTLNSEISVLGSQLTWLENDLSSSSSLTWKMAQYHRPMRPHTAWKSENNNQYYAWAQLFYDENVRLVVDCDSHMTKTTWPVKPSSDSDNDEGFVVDQTNGTVYTGEGCWGAPLRPNDDDKSWTRNSASFNQFKLIFVEPSKIELRTININNAVTVGEVSNTDPFTLPSGLNVFSPPTGDVVTISNTNDITCPKKDTPCDDNDPTTIFSIEDGSCNCVGLDKTLIDDYITEVITGSDDAEENVTTGVVNTTSTDLELIRDSNNQIVGIRFDTVEIPDNASIIRAYIQFTSDEYNNYLEPTNLVIDGELSANSSTFTTSINNISSRTKTSGGNTVLWSDVKRWGSNGIEGYFERTPNLVNIINEIKGQPGWVYGNSMTFLISGTGRRVAESYNGTSPPKLKLIYYHNRQIANANLGSQGSCDPLTDTYSQDVILTYKTPPLTGNINVNGQLFSIGASPQTVTLTGLNSNGLDVNLSAFFTDDPTNIYKEDYFFEAPSICSLGNLPDNTPDDNLNLALLSEATLSGSVTNGRGTPDHILYDPSINNYHVVTQYNEYGVNYNEGIGSPDVDNGFKWQVNWTNVKYINYITFGGAFQNQPQPNVLWRISYRLDGNWIILEEGQGGWIDSGIYEWGGSTQNPIEADALRVQLYSNGSNIFNIHLRGRGGISSAIDDSSTTPKATLIQYLSPGNNCGVTIPANTILYCDSSWIYSDGPDESSGTKNTVIADGTYIISAENDVEVNNIEIYNGATVIVKEGASLKVIGNLINNGNLILESISTKYSSLIVQGTSTGNVSYKRHVNAFNGSTGNDLVSSPFASQTFGNFVTANPNLFENPSPGNSSQKLFGPFDEPSGSYQTYDSVINSNTIIEKGVGYRAARDATKDGTYGTTLTFKGTVETGGFSLPISESSSSFSGWNLIGNPYPSYIDFDTFFNLNKTQLDGASYQAIYGYDGNASNGWTILNNLTTNLLIAPGQGFFVKSKTGGGTITFTPAMRTIGTSDDFILGRTPPTHFGYIKLELSSNLSTFSTDIYFNSNATRGLDPGYDAALQGGSTPNFSIYSYLVENSDGTPFAIQALSDTDMQNVIIPLGVNASQGQEVTISIFETDVPDSIDVYLEDTLNNTFTLLNTNDYIFTAESDISGGGRFYLRVEGDGLSVDDELKGALYITFDRNDKSIIINGQLKSETMMKLYDINGRVVNSRYLDSSSTTQTIEVDLLSAGIYIIELTSQRNEKRIQKLIIK